MVINMGFKVRFLFYRRKISYWKLGIGVRGRKFMEKDS